MQFDGQLLDSLGDLAGLGVLSPSMQVSPLCTLGPAALSKSERLESWYDWPLLLFAGASGLESRYYMGLLAVRMSGCLE